MGCTYIMGLIWEKTHLRCAEHLPKGVLLMFHHSLSIISQARNHMSSKDASHAGSAYP